ncbi:MAG: hypothetical protein ACT4OJ_16440 [Bacteroidota bacterium]
MALYYLPCLIRSDRYFITRLEPGEKKEADFNFVIPADDRVFTPLLTIEDPDKIVLNQMAPSQKQDIPLRECHISMQKNEKGFELIIRRSSSFSVTAFSDEDSGVRLDYSVSQKRIAVGLYRYRAQAASINLKISLQPESTETFSGELLFSIVRSGDCQRVVIDFGSEASQVGYKNSGPQSAILQYDILENIMSRLNIADPGKNYRREDFLNHETGQPFLYRSFYAVKKRIGEAKRKKFPFNFTDNPDEDEIRLFITRGEVGATEHLFRDEYEIIPNLKLGIEKSIQLLVGNRAEDYSILSHKQ